MSFYLFIILSALFALEASTSLARKAGYETNNPASGLMLQSSLGLLSRILVFMFMPMIGAAADSGNLFTNSFEIPIYSLLIPLMLLILFFCKNYARLLFVILLLRVNEHGSYFKKSTLKATIRKSNINKRKLLFTKFKSIYILVLIAYVPYYLSWPVIMILLDAFSEHRGFILGLSSILNGVNTIILTLFVDPKLAQIGQKKRIISVLYDELIAVRLGAAILSSIILLFFTFYII